MVASLLSRGLAPASLTPQRGDFLIRNRQFRPHLIAEQTARRGAGKVESNGEVERPHWHGDDRRLQALAVHMDNVPPVICVVRQPGGREAVLSRIRDRRE